MNLDQEAFPFVGGEDEIKFDKIIIKRRRYPFLAEREEEIFRKLSTSHFPFPSFVSSFSSRRHASTIRIRGAHG